MLLHAASMWEPIVTEAENRRDGERAEHRAVFEHQTGMGLGTQVVWLLVLALPIASIAWTVTHEEVFKEPRNYCTQASENAQSLFRRKFFYSVHLRILLQPLRDCLFRADYPLQASLLTIGADT